MCTCLWGTSSHISDENNCVSDHENEGTEAGETWEKRKLSCKSFPIPLSAPRGFMVTATALLQHYPTPQGCGFSLYIASQCHNIKYWARFDSEHPSLHPWKNVLTKTQNFAFVGSSCKVFFVCVCVYLNITVLNQQRILCYWDVLLQ